MIDALARYQSPLLSPGQWWELMRTFQDFLAKDSRHDIWLRSNDSDSTLVWDRHNIIFAYEIIDEFHEGPLRERFGEGQVQMAGPACSYLSRGVRPFRAR